MRLSKCGGCERLIDTRASACVHCQAPQQRTSWRASPSGWIAPVAIAGLALGICSGTAHASTSTGADTDGSTSTAGSGTTGSGTSASTTGDTTGGSQMSGSGTDTDASTEHETDTYPPAEPHYGTSAWSCDVSDQDPPATLGSMLVLLILAHRRRSRDSA